jgi:hypothetical protein
MMAGRFAVFEMTPATMGNRKRRWGRRACGGEEAVF